MNKLPPADFIAEISFNKFKSLPKTGKPTKSEWTILSSIIQFDGATGESKVVALGAGTKCIGQARLCPLGLILNDSHAEVLARRAFLRYIVHQLKRDSEIFTYQKDISAFVLKESVGFHFFSTQVPCGDACIVPDLTSNPNETPAKRRKLDSECSDVGNILTSSNVFTGAKLIGGILSDPMHQTMGALRTKPGRGDRTLSMSCSDKLSKWNILGIQGAFLDAVLEKPIYLETLNFSCEFNTVSMTRAIFGRWFGRVFESERFVPQKPQIRGSTRYFEYAQDVNKNPSPNGLIWSEIPDEKGPYEVSVNGKKQGITKKAKGTKKSALRISKLALLEEFCALLETYPELKNKLELKEDSMANKTYYDFKSMCTEYQKSWKSLKESYFQQWTTKPRNLLEFTLSTCNKNS